MEVVKTRKLRAPWRASDRLGATPTLTPVSSWTPHPLRSKRLFIHSQPRNVCSLGERGSKVKDLKQWCAPESLFLRFSNSSKLRCYFVLVERLYLVTWFEKGDCWCYKRYSRYGSILLSSIGCRRSRKPGCFCVRTIRRRSLDATPLAHAWSEGNHGLL